MAFQHPLHASSTEPLTIYIKLVGARGIKRIKRLRSFEVFDPIVELYFNNTQIGRAKDPITTSEFLIYWNQDFEVVTRLSPNDTIDIKFWNKKHRYLGDARIPLAKYPINQRDSIGDSIVTL
jgi:hypothetical protein